MKFSIKDLVSKCDQIRRKLKNLPKKSEVRFTEEIFNGKLHFLCSVSNGPLTDGPFSVDAFLRTLLLQLFRNVTLSLYTTLFSCWNFFALKFFFALHSFYVALFPYRTFFIFCITLFLCCTFFMLHYFHVSLFPCCALFMLYFFLIAAFSCYTFFMLLFPRVTLLLWYTVICEFFQRRFAGKEL